MIGFVDIQPAGAGEDLISQVGDIFSPGGLLSRSKNFEYRPEQQQMAVAVARALERKEHLVVEAGTGVGKSLAYLIPAILFAVRNHKKAIISTHTINLQEQLIEKDLPMLANALPVRFEYTMLKGRQNYLCTRRLAKAMQQAESLFTSPETQELQRIYEWSRKTTDGSLSDFETEPDSKVWSHVCSERGLCTPKLCGPQSEFAQASGVPCFFQKTRSKILSSDVLVLNHTLFFMHLGGVDEEVEGGVLFKNDFVIFDEAHTVERVASRHIGLNVSSGQMRYSLQRLWNPHTNKGLLATLRQGPAVKLVAELIEEAEKFFTTVELACDKLGEIQRRRAPEGVSSRAWTELRIRQCDIVNDTLTLPLQRLREGISDLIKKVEDKDTGQELIECNRRLGELRDNLSVFLSQSAERHVYWVERSGRAMRNIALNAAPVDVAEYLRQRLFGADTSVIMTSATLATKMEVNVEQSSRLLPPDASPSSGNATLPEAPARPEGTGGTPVLHFTDFDPAAPIAKHGRNLPHWRQSGCTYFVTFRLADSIPQDAMDQWELERNKWIATHPEPHSESNRAEYHKLFTEQFHAWLDNGMGCCCLNNPAISKIVEDAIRHLDGERCQLFDFVIMPNHVHIIVRPINGFFLEEILHSWKSFTAHAINTALNRTGAVWQAESFDCIVRNAAHLEKIASYIKNNPVKARLKPDEFRIGTGTGVTVEQSSRLLPPNAASSSGNATLPDAPARPERTGGTPVLRTRKNPPSAGLRYFSAHVGAEKAAALQVGSPFDYPRQMKIYVAGKMPDPRDPGYQDALIHWIEHFITMTHGKAFVLFTNSRLMMDTGERMAPFFEKLGIECFVQGTGTPRSLMLDKFKADINSVLFGTESFWQGVDVPGEALSNVIITRLPFSVPDHPLIEAKIEAIEARGGNAFSEFSLPEAILKFRQGVGRLIRTKTDSGIIAVLDNRVLAKRYGQAFLDAIPKCPVEVV
jgi:Rad3-related DNA helicase/REP element-mobilizing transposase RayT